MERNEENNIEVLLEIMRQDAAVWEFMNRSFPIDLNRIQLLQEIIIGVGKSGKEDLRCQVYLYGSMLKGKDLIARQIFLCLQAMVESMA